MDRQTDGQTEGQAEDKRALPTRCWGPNNLDIIYQNLAKYYYVRQLFPIFLFILYTGSNSEDPDEMQHMVAFYQDLHCHLQGLKNIIIPTLF